MVVCDFVGLQELFVGGVGLVFEFEGDVVALGEGPAEERLEGAFDVDVEFDFGEGGDEGGYLEVVHCGGRGGGGENEGEGL